MFVFCVAETTLSGILLEDRASKKEILNVQMFTPNVLVFQHDNAIG